MTNTPARDGWATVRENPTSFTVFIGDVFIEGFSYGAGHGFFASDRDKAKRRAEEYADIINRALGKLAVPLAVAEEMANHLNRALRAFENGEQIALVDGDEALQHFESWKTR